MFRGIRPVLGSASSSHPRTNLSALLKPSLACSAFFDAVAKRLSLDSASTLLLTEQDNNKHIYRNIIIDLLKDIVIFSLLSDISHLHG